MKRRIKPDIFVQRILSDVRVGDLEPGEVKDIREFIRVSGLEKSITSRTKLSLIYALWLNEKAKQRRSKKALKKAEYILSAQTLTFWEHVVRRPGYERDRKKKGRRRSKWELSGSHEKANPLAGLRKNLAKLGITEDKKVERLLDGIKKNVKTKCEVDAISELDRRAEKVLEKFGKNITYAKERFSKEYMVLALPLKEFNQKIDSMLKEAEKKVKLEAKKLHPEENLK